MNDIFSITVFLPDCSFEAEVNKINISDEITKIEKELSSRDIPDDVYERINDVVINVMGISSMIGEDLINKEEGCKKIIYNFLYAVVKQNSLEIDDFSDIDAIIGLTSGTHLYIQAYEDLVSYKTQVKIIENMVGVDVLKNISIPPSPTIH